MRRQKIVNNDCFIFDDGAVAGQCSVQPVSEHLVGVLARHAWRAVDDCRSAREPGGRGRLGYAIADEKGVAGCQLRKARCICHAEYGCHTGVAVAEYLHPLLSRTRGEGVADLASQLRPRMSIELRGGIRREFEQAQELGVELRFGRPDGHELCIRSLIDAVER